jgi:cob(I)alamin adenosyltransferase
MIHIYCGPGKGKTTAAIGLIARAAGHGLKTLLVQFLKDGTSGELISLQHLPGVQIVSGQLTRKFSIAMNTAERQATCDLHRQYLSQAHDLARQGQLDLLVLDEVLGAIESGLLPEREVLALMRSKPAHLEIVLTGRNPSAELLGLADYISRIQCDRHPYERGIMAREGIEY